MRFKVSVFMMACSTLSQSEAAIRVWHEAIGTTPNASVITQGIPGTGGEPLRLLCDKSLGDCAWNVSVKLLIENGTSGYWDLFLRDPAGNSTNLWVSNSSYAGSPYTIPEILSENLADGFLFYGRAFANPQIQASQTVHTIHTFTLTKFDDDFMGDISVFCGTFAGFGGFEPIDPGDFRFASCGPNNPAQVFPLQFFHPAIVIENVPEPGTAGLLAMGAVLMVRRRR